MKLYIYVCVCTYIFLIRPWTKKLIWNAKSVLARTSDYAYRNRQAAIPVYVYLHDKQS